MQAPLAFTPGSFALTAILVRWPASRASDVISTIFQDTGTTKQPVLSSDAALTGILPSVGSLSPAFSSTNLSYAVTLPAGSSSIQLTATRSDANATVTATFANGEDQTLGKVAMATFPAMSGLRPTGDSHWQSTGESGPPTIDAATNGPMGAIRAGALERSNVDITEELVMLMAAQRNFQANAKAIEGASQLTQTIIGIR